MNNNLTTEEQKLAERLSKAVVKGLSLRASVIISAIESLISEELEEIKKEKSIPPRDLNRHYEV